MILSYTGKEWHGDLYQEQVLHKIVKVKDWGSPVSSEILFVKRTRSDGSVDKTLASVGTQQGGRNASGLTRNKRFKEGKIKLNKI